MRILITGGTSGIGRAVALLLGQRGVDVDVIGGGSEARGAELGDFFRFTIEVVREDLAGPPKVVVATALPRASTGAASSSSRSTSGRATA